MKKYTPTSDLDNLILRPWLYQRLSKNELDDANLKKTLMVILTHILAIPLQGFTNSFPTKNLRYVAVSIGVFKIQTNI